MSHTLVSTITHLGQEELATLRKSCITDPKILGFNVARYTGRNNEKRWRIELPHEKPNQRVRQLLHRYLYEKEYGKLPNKLYVLHKCGNSLCLNLNHLKAGTHDENMKDAVRHGSFEYKTLGYDTYLKVYEMYKNTKLTMRQIGYYFGITQTYVSRIIRTFEPNRSRFHRKSSR